MESNGARLADAHCRAAEQTSVRPMRPNNAFERTVKHGGPRLAAAQQSLAGRSTGSLGCNGGVIANVPNRVAESCHPMFGTYCKQLADDGWVVVTIRGSHRQLKHPSKPGRVTVHGKPSDSIAPGTLNSILKQSGLKK